MVISRISISISLYTPEARRCGQELNAKRLRRWFLLASFFLKRSCKKTPSSAREFESHFCPCCSALSHLFTFEKAWGNFSCVCFYMALSSFQKWAAAGGMNIRENPPFLFISYFQSPMMLLSHHLQSLWKISLLLISFSCLEELKNSPVINHNRKSYFSLQRNWEW